MEINIEGTIFIEKEKKCLRNGGTLKSQKASKNLTKREKSIEIGSFFLWKLVEEVVEGVGSVDEVVGVGGNGCVVPPQVQIHLRYLVARNDLISESKSHKLTIKGPGKSTHSAEILRNAAGWICSMLFPLSQNNRAMLALRISMSCSRVNGALSAAPFSKKKRSPTRVLKNCSVRMQRKVGPARAPLTCDSNEPPTVTSTSS